MIKYHHQPGSSEICVVAFASIMGGISGYGEYEFLGTFDNAPASVLYLKDENRTWYQDLFLAPAGNPDSLALAELAELLAGYRRVVTIGYSAGAYAALLAGNLLNADVNVAIAPQTRLDQAFLDRVGDARWVNPMRRINAEFSSSYFDLGAALKTPLDHRSVILTGASDPLDRDHLAALDQHEQGRQAVVVALEGRDHKTTARALKSSGFFLKMRDAFLEQGSATFVANEIRRYALQVPKTRAYRLDAYIRSGTTAQPPQE